MLARTPYILDLVNTYCINLVKCIGIDKAYRGPVAPGVGGGTKYRILKWVVGVFRLYCIRVTEHGILRDLTVTS